MDSVQSDREEDVPTDTPQSYPHSSQHWNNYCKFADRLAKLSILAAVLLQTLMVVAVVFVFCFFLLGESQQATAFFTGNPW